MSVARTLQVGGLVGIGLMVVFAMVAVARVRLAERRGAAGWLAGAHAHGISNAWTGPCDTVQRSIRDALERNRVG